MVIVELEPGVASASIAARRVVTDVITAGVVLLAFIHV